MRSGVFIFLFVISIPSLSQSTEDIFNNKFILRNGIYASYKEILENSPKYPDCSLKVDYTFFDTTYYNYIDEHSNIREYNDTLFAVVNNGILYIRHNARLIVVFIKGAISIFNTGSNPIALSDDNFFIVDLMNGSIKRLNIKNLEEIIMRDNGLYDEYSRLTKSEKRKLLYPYILRYNERNPIVIE